MGRVILRSLAACVLLLAGCSSDEENRRGEATTEWPDALAPPNERALAFVDQRMELSGGGETVVLEDLLNVTEATQAEPAFAAWSTDGRFVAYVRSSFWSPEDPETIVPEGATLVIVDTRTGDRVERPANTHDALIFSDDVLVVSTDEGIATVDPESGEELSEVRRSRVGRFLGVTSAGLVSARVNGSLLRTDQPWSTEVFLVQLDGFEQHVSSIDHDGDEVAALAYDPVSMTFAMATKVPPSGVTDPNICEPNGRVATVPLGDSTLTDIPLPPAPDGRRWQATSLYFRLDGTLVVRLADYPLDCDTGDWLTDEHWFVLHDGQLVPMTDPEEIGLN